MSILHITIYRIQRLHSALVNILHAACQISRWWKCLTVFRIRKKTNFTFIGQPFYGTIYHPHHNHDHYHCSEAAVCRCSSKQLVFFAFLLIGIHSMQDWTAITRHEVTRKRNTKKITAYRKSVYKEPTVKGYLLIRH